VAVRCGGIPAPGLTRGPLTPAVSVSSRQLPSIIKAPSCSSSQRLRSSPPPKPVSAPLAPTTRWQGTMMGIGFFPLAAPTARGEAHVAQAARQVAIAQGAPVRDGAEDIPHAPLKRRAGRVQGDVEGRGGPAEVLRELLAGSGEKTTRRSAPVPPTGRDFPCSREPHAGEPGVGRGDHKLADRARKPDRCHP